MSDSDTAVLCLGKARAWTAARRVVTLAGMLLACMSVVWVTAASAHSCASAHTTIAHTPRADLQRAVVCLINQQRHHRGLPSLHENQRLNRSAQGWTNVMVTHRNFSHGADFASRISAVGFDWSNVGENIATGYATPATVVRAWMASKGHCQNILNPQYRDVGTGVSDNPVAGYSTLAGTWTQDFGLLMGQHAPSGNWAPAEGCPYTHA